MHVDQLESRTHFTITITTTGPEIVVIGDDSDDLLTVQKDASGLDGEVFEGSFRLTSNSSFLVDGRMKGGITPGNSNVWYEKLWNINLGDGNDSIEVQREAGLPSASINLGSGNDRINIQTEIGTGYLNIDAGSGDDYIEISIKSLRNFSYFGGAGRDRLHMSGVPISGKLQIIDTQGPSSVFIGNCSISKETSIITGNSIDRITLTQCSFGRSVLIATHGGNDVITHTGSRFRSTKDIFPGAGKDTIIP